MRDIINFDGDSKKPPIITASFGVAERRQHNLLAALIHEADERLYHAKRNGRNRIVGGAQTSELETIKMNLAYQWRVSSSKLTASNWS